MSVGEDGAGDGAVKKQKEADSRDSKGPPSSKGYFLFSQGKTQSVAKNDFGKIKRYISRRLEEYQGPLIKQHEAESNSTALKVVAPRMTIEQFWLKQISNLAIRYPLFCQENTYLTSKVISGLEKFPIQYWNNPGEKLCSLNSAATKAANGQSSVATGLELKDLGVAGFFFKSGYKSLEAQKIPKSKHHVKVLQARQESVAGSTSAKRTANAGHVSPKSASKAGALPHQENNTPSRSKKGASANFTTGRSVD